METKEKKKKRKNEKKKKHTLNKKYMLGKVSGFLLKMQKRKLKGMYPALRTRIVIRCWRRKHTRTNVACGLRSGPRR